MNHLLIRGGERLIGTIRIDSAKNAVLPILAASLLADGTTIIHNTVPIRDVNNMLDLLRGLGVSVTKKDGDLRIDTRSADRWLIPHDIAREIRSSIFLLGSILSRFGTAKVSYPGGCDIGLRPIDLHLKGLATLGVAIEEDDGYIVCDGSHMRCGTIHLDYPSVGATENLMMAAVRLDGTTVISNAAKEPEIVDLAAFVNAMGGRVAGAGTDTVTIEGVSELAAAEYAPMPDRIIAGTYLIAGAMTGGDVTVTNVRADDLGALLSKLREGGAELEIGKDSVRIRAPERMTACQEIQTLPYPGFATDLQAQMSALQSVSDGTCVVIENLFETRYKYVPELVKMGAHVTVCNRCAFVRGVKSLHGSSVRALDLRGGAALVLAGLAARGTTTVENVEFIDRGYYRIEEQLAALGAQIKRMP